MNWEQTKLRREVMEAQLVVMRHYENGGDVQYENNGLWHDFGDSTPAWQFQHTLYRIKPAPKLRPYTAEEAELLVGKVLVRIGDKKRFLTSHAHKYGDRTDVVFTNGCISTPSEVSRLFTHEDGSACGVLE